ncbi:unnamed protein product [Didymodactylos carnosus]|uniref:Uncharacterized protein n=1 Tax=Didymodactylos carnosus TaxID=1234261 RepID=A0A8S2JDH9_9BILA|nr:unnamed protein product [Didymodactylos carnosus]CAF3793404.1 unnamed protein product [Didymodactylos carnosus]
MFYPRASIRPSPVLLLPAFPSQLGCRFAFPFQPSSISTSASILNFNTSANATSSSLTEALPLSELGRDDYFCVDPSSLSVEQLSEYKREMTKCKYPLQ